MCNNGKKYPSRAFNNSITYSFSWASFLIKIPELSFVISRLIFFHNLIGCLNTSLSSDWLNLLVHPQKEQAIVIPLKCPPKYEIRNIGMLSINGHTSLINFKTKRKTSDPVLWQKPLHQQKCQKGKVTTQTTPQKSSIKQQTTKILFVWLRS